MELPTGRTLFHPILIGVHLVAVSSVLEFRGVVLLSSSSEGEGEGEGVVSLLVSGLAVSVMPWTSVSVIRVSASG